ncbi:hypothetical protein [Streptomyces sp. S186]|uniref:hypothetical protein n=1 Tax=Streptomyces sp. S186 TaxID=3434395 RepID=UPI003F670440
MRMLSTAKIRLYCYFCPTANCRAEDRRLAAAHVVCVTGAKNIVRGDDDAHPLRLALLNDSLDGPVKGRPSGRPW